jgi:hypothetical protein
MEVPVEKKTADAEFDHRCFAVTFPFPMLRSEIMKMLKKKEAGSKFNLEPTSGRNKMFNVQEK